MTVKQRLSSLLTGQRQAQPIQVYTRTPPPDVVHGVRQLNQRQRQVTRWLLIIAILLAGWVMLLPHLSAWAYGWYGLQLNPSSIHIPAAVEQTLQLPIMLDRPSDYSGSLLFWLLRLAGVLWLSRWLVGWARRQRWVNNILKRMLLGLILVVALMQGSGWLLERLNRSDTARQHWATLVSDQPAIENSWLALHLVDAQATPVQQAYVLAQGQLLRGDTLAARQPRVDALIQAERNDPQFARSGLDPQVLWTLQQQTYGRAITPQAKQFDGQASSAQRLSRALNWLGGLVAGLGVMMILALLLIRQMLVKRIRRIKAVYDENP